jgi:ubiquinone biosynthesis protein
VRRRGSPSRALRRAAIRIGARRIRARLAGVPLAERRRATGRELAAVLGELRGIYTKLGQYLALRADLVPDEVREELQTLTDSAPASPFPAIRRALEQGLGPIGQRFAWIDPNPIGSASIAQVHLAHLIGEGVVAVKVRHPELTPERLEADLRILRRALRRLRRRLGLREAERPIGSSSRWPRRCARSWISSGRGASPRRSGPTWRTTPGSSCPACTGVPRPRTS